MRPLVKIHGGKNLLAKNWIIPHLPQNYEQMVYVEPFCGQCSVLLNKNPSLKEIISDLDYKTINLIEHCQKYPLVLLNRLSRLNYDEQTFLRFKNQADLNLTEKVAVQEFVIRRMSRGGLGKDFAWSDRLRGGKPGDLNSWETSLKNISKISERLKNVEILNEDFRAIITRFDSSNTIFYADPPYLMSTRTAKNVYNHEMSEQDHRDLLDILTSIKGKALVSGYPSKLYNDHFYLLLGWNRYEKSVKNNSGQGKIKQERREVLWTNY